MLQQQEEQVSVPRNRVRILAMHHFLHIRRSIRTWYRTGDHKRHEF